MYFYFEAASLCSVRNRGKWVYPAVGEFANDLHHTILAGLNRYADEN